MKNKKGTLLLLHAIFIGLFSIGKITAQTNQKIEINKVNQDDAKYLKGFDEKAVVAELKKKGVPVYEYKEIINSRKAKYIAKQKATEKPNLLFPKPYNRNLRTSTVCANAGFEDTTFTGWTGGTGDCSNYPTPTVWNLGLNTGALNLGPNTSTQQDLLTCTTCYDPCCGTAPGIPYVAPGGGNVSVRLGNNQTNSGTEYLQYDILVTSLNTSFTYQYAVVLEDPGHTATQQPRFDIVVTDSAGNAVSGPCGAYDVNATNANSDPTFFPFGVGPDGYYKPWTTVTIDLHSYVGSHMLIRFTTQDCTLGGHYGYAYIDASCSQLQTTVAFCPTDTIVRVTAPVGFTSYQWYTVSPNVAIPGATSSTLTVLHPVVGTQYTVVMSTVSGCGSSLTATLQNSNMTLLQNSTNVTCNGLTDGAANVVQSGGNGPFTFTWTNAAGTFNRQITDTTGTDAVTNLAPGDYYVHAQTPGGCLATDTIHITQPAPLPLTHIGTPFCPNDASVVLTAPAGSNYQWADASNTPFPGEINSTYTVNSPVLGQAVIVNYTPTGGGCTNGLRDSLYYAQIAVQLVSTVNDSCFGLNDGQATVSVSGLSSTFFTYNWDNGTPPAVTTTTGTLTNAGPGTYTVTATSTGGCVNTATFTISQPPPPAPTNIVTYICPHEAQATISLPGATGTNYQWYDPSGGPIPAPAGTSPTYTAMNPTLGQSYSVHYIPNGSFCTAIVIDSFQLYHLNSMVPTSQNATCYGYNDGSASVLPPTSNPSGLTGPFAYYWVYTTSSAYTNTTTSATNLFAGTYYVTATTPGGCTTADTIVIGQQPNGFDTLRLTTKFCPGDSPIILHVPSGYSQYTWYENANATGTPIPNNNFDSLIVVFPVVGTQYSIEMPNPAGGSACNIIIHSTLDYSLPPPAPNFITTTNVFSPNGDGKNDFFLLNQNSYKYIAQFHLEIFNRWGKKIYETNDFTSQWDGKIDSNNAVEGVYYWIASYTQACLINAPTTVAKGFVQIVR